MSRKCVGAESLSELIMRGVITFADVLGNLRLIWSEFGSLCLIRCLAAVARPKPSTFLQVALATRKRKGA